MGDSLYDQALPFHPRRVESLLTDERLGYAEPEAALLVRCTQIDCWAYAEKVGSWVNSSG